MSPQPSNRDKGGGHGSCLEQEHFDGDKAVVKVTKANKGTCTVGGLKSQAQA